MLNLLRHDPELLAIADAIVATQVYEANDAVNAVDAVRDRSAQDAPE